MKLAELQAQFQKAILTGSDEILSGIPDSPREKRAKLFGVYRDAYVIRLADILSSDFEMLHTYIGDGNFERVAHDYIAANPSHTPNARWFGKSFPEFVAKYEAFADKPAVAAIAKLEGFLGEVFDVADVAPIGLDALSKFKPDDFERLSFAPHPSVRRFQTHVNLDAIWSALREEQTPPPPEVSKEPVTFLVWRKDMTPHYRALPREEAMMWYEAAKGVRFGVLCEMIAAFDDPEQAPVRAAQYLQAWIVNGLVGGVRRQSKRTR